MPNTQEELFFSVNRAKSHNMFVVGTLQKIVLTNLKQLKTFLAKTDMAWRRFLAYNRYGMKGFFGLQQIWNRYGMKTFFGLQQIWNRYGMPKQGLWLWFWLLLFFSHLPLLQWEIHRWNRVRIYRQYIR